MRRSWVLVVGCPSRIRTSVHGSKVRCPTTRRRGSGAFGKGCGAEDGTRTRDPHLGKVMLYQLSHFRSELDHPERWCRGPGSNWRHRDFQSRALPTELPRPDGEPRWVPPRRFAGYHGPFGARHGRLSSGAGASHSEPRAFGRGQGLWRRLAAVRSFGRDQGPSTGRAAVTVRCREPVRCRHLGPVSAARSCTIDRSERPQRRQMIPWATECHEP